MGVLNAAIDRNLKSQAVFQDGYGLWQSFDDFEWAGCFKTEFGLSYLLLFLLLSFCLGRRSEKKDGFAGLENGSVADRAVGITLIQFTGGFCAAIGFGENRL